MELEFNTAMKVLLQERYLVVLWGDNPSIQSILMCVLSLLSSDKPFSDYRSFFVCCLFDI